MSGPGIPWTTVEKALHTWVVWATGLPATSVVWAGQNKARLAAPYITMRIGSVLRQGLDWVKYTRRPLTFNPLTVSGYASGALVVPGHGLLLGDGPVQVAATAIPTGLTALTDYWAIPVDANTLELAASFFDARAGVAIGISDAGTAATVVSTANTLRAGQEKNALTQGMRKVSLTMQAFVAAPGAAVGSSSATALLDAVVSGLARRASLLRASGVGVMNLGPVRGTDGVINASVFEPRAILEATLSLASEVQDTTTIIERVLIGGTVDGTSINSQIPPGGPWSAGFGPGFGG